MKIAIAGFGLEGRANLKYFRAKFPAADFTIFDEREKLDDVPSFAKTVLGEDAFAQIHGCDLVLRSPSVAPRRIPSGNAKIWSAANEFFAECPAPIIGVTGTKGKGTTCGFITEILRAAGKNVHLLGNIGVPALAVLPQIQPDDWVVYELSSFQLWDLEWSPQVAAMTLIEPDHLDVHANFAEYVAAKARIFQWQKPGDVAVYNTGDALVREIAETAAQRTSAALRPFLNKKFTHIQQGEFYYGSTKIGATGVVKLPGEHNLHNAAAAINATWDIVGGDTAAIARGLGNFRGLPHRLKFVRTVGEVAFYDDSIATTPGSAIAALNSFGASKILLLGGHDKGADYAEIGAVIEKLNRENRGENDAPSVRGVVVFGANRAKIREQIAAETGVEIIEINTDKLARQRTKIQTDAPENRDQLADISRQAMALVVRASFELAEPGDTVILSPAAASFDLFNSYAERGEMFAKAVKDLENL